MAPARQTQAQPAPTLHRILNLTGMAPDTKDLTPDLTVNESYGRKHSHFGNAFVLVNIYEVYL